MIYNERLMNESLQGNDDSLEELKFNASSGDCEAQYYLAMFYEKANGHLHDSDYHYWFEKSKENGYVPGVGKPVYDDDGASIGVGFHLGMEDLYLALHFASLFRLI